jgi:hypothetical protein
MSDFEEQMEDLVYVFFFSFCSSDLQLGRRKTNDEKEYGIRANLQIKRDPHRTTRRSTPHP